MTDGIVIARSSQQLDEPSIIARTLEPLTRTLFIEAGLRSGMSVLDAWSGAGDLAMLAREIVRAPGEVTGFDESAQMVAYATERAAFRGLKNVQFVEAEISNLPFRPVFDAIIGRAVLMYRRDPVADLQALVRFLRPGGLVIFQEFDLLPGKTVPPVPLIDRVRDWLLEAFASAGIEMEMGPKLYETFTGAGLPPPEMRLDGFLGGADGVPPALVAGAARMVMPLVQALGIATSDDVQIDTLEERMREELRRSGGVMSAPPLVGGWTRLPG